MTSLKKILILFFLISTLFLPHVLLADSFGTDATAKAAGLSEKYNKPVPEIVGNIIGSALSMIGVIFFILMVYGGFLWMTARGDEPTVKKAKETIIAAVIGLIIVMGSFAITNFVFTSADSSATSSLISLIV